MAHVTKDYKGVYFKMDKTVLESLNNFCQANNVNKTEIVETALMEYIERTSETDNIYRVIEKNTGRPMRGGCDFTSFYGAHKAVMKSIYAHRQGEYYPQGGYKIVEIRKES